MLKYCNLMDNRQLEIFEKERLRFEERISEHDLAITVVQRYGRSPHGPGELHLHAASTITALIATIASHPQSLQTLKSYLQRASQGVYLRPHAVTDALKAYGIAYYYKICAKKNQLPQLSQLVSQLISLQLLPPVEHDKIDLVLNTLSSRKEDGRKNLEPPAELFLWWVSGKSPKNLVYQTIEYLGSYQSYIDRAHQQSLEYKVLLPLPFGIGQSQK